MTMPSYMYQPETFGSEFSVLTYVSLIYPQNMLLTESCSDFLETLDDGTFFTPPTTVAPSLVSSASFTAANPSTNAPPSTTNVTVTTTQPQAAVLPVATSTPSSSVTDAATPSSAEGTSASEAILPAATKTEKFLLTAADQESGSRDERLNRVIRSKYEAGLLKPYNYVKGYARLSRWMDRK